MKEETLGTVSFSLPSVDKGEREIARVYIKTREITLDIDLTINVQVLTLESSIAFYN